MIDQCSYCGTHDIEVIPQMGDESPNDLLCHICWQLTPAKTMGQEQFIKMKDVIRHINRVANHIIRKLEKK